MRYFRYPSDSSKYDMNLISPSIQTHVSGILILTLLVSLLGAYNFLNNSPKSLSYICCIGLGGWTIFGGIIASWWIANSHGSQSHTKWSLAFYGKFNIL
jgi:hypothetical protein